MTSASASETALKTLRAAVFFLSARARATCLRESDDNSQEEEEEERER